MDAIIKKIDHAKSLTFVQFDYGDPACLPFKTGVKLMEKGKLLISEPDESERAEILKADNQSDDFLLLTDVDILKGGKQNRLVNKSILLAPHSGTLLEVSSLEQNRQEKQPDTFMPSSHKLDFLLRAKKAWFMANKHDRTDKTNLQSMLWNEIDQIIKENAFESPTRNYDALSEYLVKKDQVFKMKVNVAPGCKGLLTLNKGKIISLDIFGNEEVYMHYFEGLVKAAFRTIHASSGLLAVRKIRTRRVVKQLMEIIYLANKIPDKNYLGVGNYTHFQSKGIIGSKLTYQDELIHMNAFGT